MKIETPHRKIVVDSYRTWSKQVNITLETSNGYRYILSLEEAYQLLGDLTKELAGMELEEDKGKDQDYHDGVVQHSAGAEDE